MQTLPKDDTTKYMAKSKESFCYCHLLCCSEVLLQLLDRLFGHLQPSYSLFVRQGSFVFLQFFLKDFNTRFLFLYLFFKALFLRQKLNKKIPVLKCHGEHDNYRCAIPKKNPAIWNTSTLSLRSFAAPL